MRLQARNDPPQRVIDRFISTIAKLRVPYDAERDIEFFEATLYREIGYTERWRVDAWYYDESGRGCCVNVALNELAAILRVASQ